MGFCKMNKNFGEFWVVVDYGAVTTKLELGVSSVRLGFKFE